MSFGGTFLTKIVLAAPLLLLGTCLPRSSWCQLPAITFESLTMRDGLPSNTVLCAAKDQRGVMWFGTRRCPVRYDGNTFKSLLNRETHFVTGIATDDRRGIWIAEATSGIGRIDGQSLRIQPLPGAPGAPGAGHFFIDSFQQGWYSDREGVNRRDLRTGRTVHYPFRKSSFVWNKGSFVEDRQRNLWVIGSDNGLFRYDRRADKLSCVLGADSPDSLRRKQMLLTKACVGPDGTLWIGTYDQGLCRFDPQTGAYRNYPTGQLSGDVTSVEAGVDEQGKPLLWIGSQHGLGVFRPEQGQFYFFENLLPEPFWVYHIYRDPAKGIVWVCTSEGILKYHPQSNLFETVAIPPGLVPFPVTIHSILADRTDTTGDTYWLGLSHTGMLRWNRRKNGFTLVPFPPAGSSPETRWMVQRPDGTLWIGVNRWGYRGDGLVVYDPRSRRFLKTPLSRLANRHYSVPFFMYGFFDGQQRLWIGNSDEGIHVLDERSCREVTPWDSRTQGALLRDNNLINDVHLARDGRVWLALYRGVYLADEQGKFVRMDSLGKAAHPPEPATNTVFEDRQGNIWAARWGSVTRMRADSTIQTLATSHTGLGDRENRGLAEDRWGNIWLGNYEGLHCFRNRTNRLMRFTSNDGLTSNNTLDRVFLSPDGNELLVGQVNGLNLLRIDKLFQPQPPPPVVLSTFTVHGRERRMDFSRPVRLNRSENAFSADFVALNYGKLHNNRYAYYLEGLEKGWIDSGTRHVASYTNLDPGNYVLHLKAGSSIGSWQSRALRIPITVLPAFYETWWFRGLLGLVIAAALYAFYRYRINEFLRLQRVRNRISADLHDEIGASLSGISLMGAMAQRGLQASHPSAHFLLRMLEETHQISSSLDDIVWSINPKNDGLASLLARMTRYASELLEAKGIDHHITLPHQFEHLKLSMDQRRDFYLVFKEAVNNLVKHAHCTQAWIHLRVQQNHVQLIVRDNGAGFDLGAQTERNGLRNQRRRSENLKGKLTLQAAPGKGTLLELVFPIRR